MSRPPSFYTDMKEQHPELVSAFESLGSAARKAGPLDAKTAALAKLAISIGAGHEGSTHSSVRKALSAGCDPDEVRHVALLSVTTLGFPSMMRARSWIEDELRKAE
ncbi:MAG: carboxymuconolactone decarboxylase family protein [Planctomycetota bacterium]